MTNKTEATLSDGTIIYIDMDEDLQIYNERQIYIEKRAIPELLQFLMRLNDTNKSTSLPTPEIQKEK